MLVHKMPGRKERGLFSITILLYCSNVCKFQADVKTELDESVACLALSSSLARTKCSQVSIGFIGVCI